MEKKTERVGLACTPSEKSTWETAFGEREISRTIRILLNAAAHKVLSRKTPKQIFDESILREFAKTFPKLKP